MDKLILICFCFALLTSHLQYVSSESETEDEERPVLPKEDLLDSFTQGQQNQNLLPQLPALSKDNELPKSINNSNNDDNKKFQPPVLNTYAENEINDDDSIDSTSSTSSIISTTTTTTTTTTPKSIDVTSTSNEDKLPPISIDFESDIEKKSNVNRSSASNTNNYSELAQPEKLKPFLPLGNTSAGDHDETTDTDTTNKAEFVRTGKEQLSQNKNIIGLLKNQELPSSSPKYKPEEQLLKHNPNSEEVDKQNSMPELMQKQPYQHGKDFKTEIDRQKQNQFLHINASQKNLSERIQKLWSKSKPQLPHKKDANKQIIDVFYDDIIDDAFDSYTDSNASEGNDQLYSYTKKNASIKNDSEKVHISASDQQQQLVSLQQANNKQSSFPWSPVDSKHKAFTSNDNDIGEEDSEEEKETNSYIINEGIEEYNFADTFDADNADSYSKTKTHNNSDEKNDANSDDDFAKEDGFQNINEDDSNIQTGRSNEEDEMDYKTESDNADNENNRDDMGNIGFNNQVKEEDSSNHRGRSNEEDETVYKTESDKADSETDEDDLEDIENVGYNNHSSVDDESIDEEEDSAVDSSDRDEAEEISDVDAKSAVALYKEAVNSTLLPGSHSKNDQDTERRLVSDKEDKDNWFYQEKNDDDDDEDYTENEGNKDDSEEYKDEGDDFVLGEHDNGDVDEEYDVTKWTQHGYDDDGDTDWDDETEDDFDESKSHLVDELAKKNKQPTAPTRMVLFYTWMIVAVLLIIVGVSTYQSRCRGFRFFGTKASNPKDDRKRLMEHEFV